jgi:hypothetical protein
MIWQRGPVPEGEDFRYFNLTNLTNLTVFFDVIQGIQGVNLRSGWVLELLEAAGKSVRHNAGRNLEPWRRNARNERNARHPQDGM